MTADHDSPQASDLAAVAGEEVAANQAAGSHEPEPDDLLRELSRAMLRAALAQHRRMIDEVGRLRSTQAEAIKVRTAGEAEQLKRDSEADIREIDVWAQTATELIAAERVRRIDARRERLQAQLARQDVISQRELMAVDVALEDHEAALEAFFTRLESETDPAAIARLASAVPSLPSLSDAAEAARRHAVSEFAPIDEVPDELAEDAGSADEAAEVSQSRLMAVMDPHAAHGPPALVAAPWPEPRATAVPAGAGLATARTDEAGESDQHGPVAAGSPMLLRSIPTIRPMDRLRGRNRSPGDDLDPRDRRNA